MLGDYGPLFHARRPWSSTKQEGIGHEHNPVNKKNAKQQAAIDRCVYHCPWPDKSGMCNVCNGHPERFESKNTFSLEKAFILWLECRAKDPGNPRPERTRAILRELKNAERG